MFDYTKVPGSDHMLEGVKRYLENGKQPGHFLTAVICSNLKEAVIYADDKNLNLLPEWVKFFYNETPNNSWGTPEIMATWMKSFEENEGLEKIDDRGNEP